MASNPSDPNLYDYVREPDPLLRAAAESLYEAQGNPFSNPEPVVNSKHWRKHDAMNFNRGALGQLVDLMVTQDYALKDSPYADKRRFGPGLKLLAEEKVLFHKLLSDHMDTPTLATAQEVVLLGQYRAELKSRPNDLSPTLAAQLEEVDAGIASRCDTIAARLGDAVERCNVRAFPPAGGWTR